MSGRISWNNVRSFAPRFALLYTIITLALMPRFVFAQTKEAQQTLKWFAKLSPKQEIQACEFVRIDVELKVEKTTKLLGFDFGLLLSSTDEEVTIWSHCLLTRTFPRNCRVGDDHIEVSYTRLDLRETLSNLESILENRKRNFANLVKHRALSEELLRYPLLPRNRFLLVLQLFYGLQGGNIDGYIASVSVQTLDYPYQEYAHPSLDDLQEKDKFELIRFVVSEVLCEYSFRKLSDTSVNLDTCLDTLEELLRCDLEDSSNAYLLQQKASLERLDAMGKRDRFLSRKPWEEIENKCRNLSNLPLEYIREGICFDEKSKQLWKEIEKLLKDDDIEPLLQSNMPTRCVFIRNSFDYSPRVLTVGELFGDLKDLDGTVEPPAEKTSGQSNNP